VTLRSLLALSATIAALHAAPAEAQPRGGSGAPGRGSNILSFWGVLDPGPVDGFGVGVRYMLPIVPEGILGHARVRDELTLEFGADFLHYNESFGYYGYNADYNWNGFLPVLGATWNLWFTPRLALYPKLDLGYWVGSYSGWDDRYNGYYTRHDFDGFFIQGALGLMYRLQSVALRVEAGSGLLRIGAGFAF
jgi:hypothetical protein